MATVHAFVALVYICETVRKKVVKEGEGERNREREGGERGREEGERGREREKGGGEGERKRWCRSRYRP